MTTYYDIWSSGIFGEQPASDWDDIENVFDKNSSTYAERTLPISSGKETTKFIKCTGFDYSQTVESYIEKIVVVITKSAENTTDVNSYIMPIFDSTSNGSEYTLPTANGSFGIDITTDANGPGSGNWTWEDIYNLNINMYGQNSNASNTRWLRFNRITLHIQTPIYTATISFKDVDDLGSSWNNIANTNDGNTATYAHRSIPSGGGDSGNEIEFRNFEGFLSDDEGWILTYGPDRPVVDFYMGRGSTDLSSGAFVSYDDTTSVVFMGPIDGHVGSPPITASKRSFHLFQTTNVLFTEPSYYDDFVIIINNINHGGSAVTCYVYEVQVTFKYIMGHRKEPGGGIEDTPIQEGEPADQDATYSNHEIFRFTGGSCDTGYSQYPDWNNCANIFDASLTTYGTVTLPGMTDSEYGWATGHNASGSGDFPISVLIGFKAGSSVINGGRIYHRAYLTGGGEWPTGYVNLDDTIETHWVVLNKSSWSWSDISKLKVRIYARNQRSEEITISLDRIYIAISTAVDAEYGLEVRDASDNVTLKITDRLTRIIDSFEAPAGETVQKTYSNITLFPPVVQVIPTDKSKVPHKINTWISGTNVIVEAVPMSGYVMGTKIADDAISQIVVMEY